MITGTMRVIAGKAKGRKLHAVPGGITRPVTDRAKAALFDILGGDIIQSRFLDLFAGTGQVGIEALSRGAEAVVFVERASAAVQTIKQNLAHTKLENNSTVVRSDVFEYLRRQPTPFHYAYIAPPQYQGLWVTTLQALDTLPGWLSEDGWAVAQIHPKEYQEVLLQNLVLFDQRKYGGVMLCFYAHPEE